MQKTTLVERPSPDGDDRVTGTQSNKDPGQTDGAVARDPKRSEPSHPRENPTTEQPVHQSSAGGRPAALKARRRRLSRWGLFALLPVILLAGAYWYVTGGEVMSTDDAYVNADKVGLSTDVSGIVKEVDVSENQHVTAGQVLYRLDPRQFQIALDNAKANLAQTKLTIESMKKDYGRMQSDINAEQAQVDLDQVNYSRYATLVKTDAISKANYDQARYTLQSDQSKLSSLKGQAEVQLAKLAGNADIAVADLPQYQQAKAQVDEAQRELNHAVVKAPFAGIVTDVPAIAPGKYLQASTTAFYLVATDHVWVDANPKETELTHVRPGQPATVTVDTYPDRTWHGTVASISPAAAQEFQLLPAQNTSGNWVKVVQRVPIRVRVDTSSNQQPPLRAGMSVEVDVDTGHERGLPHFLASLFGETTTSN
jgi:membrane fusion protein (multidrug efflux system)